MDREKRLLLKSLKSELRDKHGITDEESIEELKELLKKHSLNIGMFTK